MSNLRIEVEFLLYMKEELEQLEILTKDVHDEARLRDLTARIRNLINPKGGTLLRMYNIFNLKPEIGYIANHFIAVSQSVNSAEVMKIRDTREITEDFVSSFNKKHVPENYRMVLMPEFLEIKDKYQGVISEFFSLEDYIHQPILASETKIISRLRVIKYLSNKRGATHYDDGTCNGEKRKSWEKSLDLMWYAKGGNNGSNYTKTLYLCAQIIGLEILKAKGICVIRKKLNEIYTA